MSAPHGTQTRSDRTGGAVAAADAALCRATLYTALALGFRPPSDETVERLASRTGADALAQAARMLERSAGVDGLAARVERLGGIGADVESLGVAHRRLFGHTARGEVPAYETEYGNEALFQQPQELGDLAGFTAAFSLKLRPEAHERIDHVACECELAAFLSFKEAWALATDEAEMLDVTRKAQSHFLRDHLGRFAASFAARLARADGSGFYGSLGALLLALAAHDCRRLGVAFGSEALGLRPDPAEVAAPLGCAAAEGECPARGER